MSHYPEPAPRPCPVCGLLTRAVPSTDPSMRGWVYASHGPWCGNAGGTYPDPVAPPPRLVHPTVRATFDLAASAQPVLLEVAAERDRQDKKWGGAQHDDAHDPRFFIQLIEDYAGWARVMFGMGSDAKGRARLIQVAALAVAAVESLDRKEKK